MKILLVEDDEFKASDIQKMIEDKIKYEFVDRASSVTAALKSITSKQYDLILLDMSLPTFDLSGPGGGGSPQGQGGIEVLRLSRRLGQNTCFIVVTQYPDIELDGRQLDLGEAARILTNRFKIRVISCVPYQFDGFTWHNDLEAALNKFLSAK